ncbi:MAG: MlrC C-terminal domain-containing protein, partial [Candidatus Bathyarchaeia archaeon]
HGTPIVEKGRVRLISEGIFHSQYFSGLKVEMGRTVVFRTGSVDIVITERKAPQVDPLLFRSVGIEPSEKKAVVVKSSHAFTVLFGPIAKEIIYVDTPGVCGNISSLVYRKVRRPIVPLDEM